MFVERLELVDFRSYVRADVPMAAGATTFIGSNGQGKTNLVEAVEYLSTLSSHRVSNDTPLVRLGADQAVVRGRSVPGPTTPAACCWRSRLMRDVPIGRALIELR